MAEKTCPSCGKLFTPWRSKAYCSEACRRRAENRRLRGSKSSFGTMIPDDQKSEKIAEQNQWSAKAVRGDEAPFWTACNDVTDKYARPMSDAIGWTMYIEPVEGYTEGGWFGRVGDLMKFGPTSRARARSAVEAFLEGQLFQKKTANVFREAIAGG